MTRRDLHAVGMLGLILVGSAIVFGPPAAPIWVRWAGLALFLPVLALFVSTAPRSR